MGNTTLADKYLTFSEESKKLMDAKTVELLIDTFNKVYADICDFFNNGELLNVIYTAKPDCEHIAAQFVYIINKVDYGVIVETWEEQHIVFNPEKCFEKDSPSWNMDAITHELVHVAQNSKYEYPVWINEGLADYGRAKFGLYNEKVGWRIDTRITGNKNKKQYLFGYGWAAGFFLWIEKNIDTTLPKDLNNIIKSGRYSDNYFAEKTGKTLDELWEMYLNAGISKHFAWIEKNFDIKVPKNLNDKIISGAVADEDDNYFAEKTGRTLDELWEIYYRSE